MQNPWLVEGLTEYVSTYFYETFYTEAKQAGLQADWLKRVEARKIQFSLPAAVYGDLSYFNAMNGTAPLFLTVMAKEMGQANFNAFLREYYQTYRWGGADTAAFQLLAEKQCQCDLDSIFIKWGVLQDP